MYVFTSNASVHLMCCCVALFLLMFLISCLTRRNVYFLSNQTKQGCPERSTKPVDPKDFAKKPTNSIKESASNKRIREEITPKETPFTTASASTVTRASPDDVSASPDDASASPDDASASPDDDSASPTISSPHKTFLDDTSDQESLPSIEKRRKRNVKASKALQVGVLAAMEDLQKNAKAKTTYTRAQHKNKINHKKIN
eukprot:c26041_g1_i1.p1 GENE.c26041_g1_i1~~c26041_g1_i1.p1  ORF type:complete len:200 (+),score=25.12 c26041_g1_i1:271-870(+)